MPEQASAPRPTQRWTPRGAEGAGRARLLRYVFLAGALAVTDSGCTRDFSARSAPPGTAAILQESDGTRAAPVPAWPAGYCVDLLAHQPAAGSNQPASGGAASEEARQIATARLLDLYASALLAAPRHSLLLRPDAGGDPVLLRLRAGGGPGGVNPSLFATLIPADHYVVRRVPAFSRVPGQGTPLVANLQPVAPIHVAGPVPAKPVTGLAWSVTAVPVFRSASRHAPPVLSLDLYDPHTAQRAPDNTGHHVPLAADFTTPLAVDYGRFVPERRGLRGFTGGTRDFASTGIYATEKPTPDKIPLVFVHGLISDPSSFHVLHNALEGDPRLRGRYQVWFFYYPTSLPVVYSAMLLREDLDLFIRQLDPQGVHPALHHAVLVGHSMGGLLCRLAVSDGGDRYYHHFFRQGLDQLKLTPEQHDLATRAFYYRADPNVAQVVFISTPHHGSALASGVVGRLARMFVRVPHTVRLSLYSIVSSNRAALAAGAPLVPTSSLDSLGPHAPLISAINDVPMRPGVGLHSIMGDRGRGGPLEKSSDGAVPYASSHLPEAESECIVPAGHTGTLNSRKTSDEMIRILASAK